MCEGGLAESPWPSEDEGHPPSTLRANTACKGGIEVVFWRNPSGSRLAMRKPAIDRSRWRAVDIQISVGLLPDALPPSPRIIVRITVRAHGGLAGREDARRFQVRYGGSRDHFIHAWRQKPMLVRQKTGPMVGGGDIPPTTET